MTKTMKPHHLILATFGLAVLWALCLLCRKSDPDDKASGTRIGQVTHEEDSFHHEP